MIAPVPSIWMERVPASSAHFYVAAGRVLDRLELAATRFARRHALAAHGGEPREPIRPPRARMLLGGRKPRFEVALRRVAGPVLIFLLEGRVHDTRDVAGAGKHEFHRRAEKLAAEENRFRGRDVIFAGGEVVDRDVDLA